MSISKTGTLLDLSLNFVKLEQFAEWARLLAHFQLLSSKQLCVAVAQDAFGHKLVQFTADYLLELGPTYAEAKQVTSRHNGFLCRYADMLTDDLKERFCDFCWWQHFRPT